MSDHQVDPSVRDAVADVLVRYATGIDRRDWALFRTCFTDDVEADYGDIGRWHDVDEITTWMTDIHEPCGPTLHRLTNIVVEPAGADRVRARSYVDAMVMGPDGVTGMNGIGYYDDELVTTADGWRIATRRFTMVLMRPVGRGEPA